MMWTFPGLLFLRPTLRPRFTLVLLGTAVIGLATAVAEESQHTMESSVAALAVHDGYQFRAVAREPLVVDPVSAKLDSRGRLWVVEMPDYPLGLPEGASPSGRIKVLEDRDQDGLFEQATLFAEQLNFATGVQPYRDGAFVTVAGEIVFIQDRDGDGKGDDTIVLFRGFTKENQQLRANHPTLGPDGMVYVANGLRGGSIVAVDPRFAPRIQPLDLRDRDFAFDPEGGRWGAVAGISQFGLSIDDYGRRIGCSNRNPAMTNPIGLDVIERDPLLVARDALLDVGAAAEKSRVVSRAEAWTTSNLHSGQFSAACGVFAPGIEDDHGEWMLVCEPTAYLVQRQRIERLGSVWRAERIAQDDEFFASTDTWFRPVDVAAGPGESVFVVDIARAVIEHPEFMPAELKSRPDQRDGESLGRIWQVAPESDWPSLQNLDSAEQALNWLQSDSPFQRQAASQFLMETDEPPVDELSAIVLSEQAPPRSRSRAAWWLHRIGALSAEHLMKLSTAGDPRLRAAGLEIASLEIAAGRDDWVVQGLALCRDPDPLVRRQAIAFAGGASDHSEQRVSGLAAAALNHANDDWIDRGVAGVVPDLVAALASKIVLTLEYGDRTTAARQAASNSRLLSHLVERLAVNSPDQAAEIVRRALASTELPGSLNVLSPELLEAWIGGNRRARRSVSESLAMLSAESRPAMNAAFHAAMATAEDPAATPSLRARCLGIVIATGLMPRDPRGLFADDSPPEVRVAMLGPLLRSDPQWMRDYMDQHFAEFSIRLRNAALAACVGNPDDANWLLDRIAVGSIPKTVIDPDTAKRLRQHPNAGVASKAEELLRADPDRARVLKEYATAAQSLGDPLLGKRLFVEHCSACHHIDGMGTNVGPDISDTRTKTADALLVSILDPNAAIDASFMQFQILTVDGRIFSGLLIDESATAVTLQQKGGERVAVAREEINQMQSPGVSLMPEGFERTLDQQAMSHLISYLKNWRYLNTAIPGTLTQ